MAAQLEGKKVAILLDDGFEQVEMTGPRQALEDAGAEAELISPKDGAVQGMDHSEKGEKFDVDVRLKSADPDDYDALVLPGGVANPDSLRMNPDAVKFVKAFVDAGKPIAAICHGPWTLIEAGAVKGRTMTSWPSLKTDLRNAGANWVDREVVVDRGLVTSRKPDDIPAFNKKMIEEIAEGIHSRGKESRQPEVAGGQPVSAER
jgi:protease I